MLLTVAAAVDAGEEDVELADLVGEEGDTADVVLDGVGRARALQVLTVHQGDTALVTRRVCTTHPHHAVDDATISLHRYF